MLKYRDVLHLELSSVDALRARRSRRIPVVLTREEMAMLLAGLDALPTHEPYGLMARLMYGRGGGSKQPARPDHPSPGGPASRVDRVRGS